MAFWSILHAKPRLEHAFPQPWHGRTNWSKVVQLTTFVSTMPELPPSDMVKARFAKAGNWMYIHGCTMSTEHLVGLPSSPPPLAVWRLVSLPGIIDWECYYGHACSKQENDVLVCLPCNRCNSYLLVLWPATLGTGWRYFLVQHMAGATMTFSLAGVALCLCRQSRRTVLLICNSSVANRQCEIVKIVWDVSSFVAGLRTSKQERQFWSYVRLLSPILVKAWCTSDEDLCAELVSLDLLQVRTAGSKACLKSSSLPFQSSEGRSPWPVTLGAGSAPPQGLRDFCVSLSRDKIAMLAGTIYQKNPRVL